MAPPGPHRCQPAARPTGAPRREKDLTVSSEIDPGPQRARWFKSSYSTGSCTCVEIRFATGREVEIRDSKDPRCTLAPGTEPVIKLSIDEWQQFQSVLRVTRWLGSTPHILATQKSHDELRLECRRSGTALLFNRAEWEAFVAGVQSHEFLTEPVFSH